MHSGKYFQRMRFAVQQLRRCLPPQLPLPLQHAMHSGAPLGHDWSRVFVTAQTLPAEWSIVQPTLRQDRPTGRIPKYPTTRDSRPSSQWSSWAAMRKLRNTLRRGSCEGISSRALEELYLLFLDREKERKDNKFPDIYKNQWKIAL